MTPFAEAEAEPGPEKTLCTHCGEPVGRGPGLLDRLQSQGKRAAGVDAPAAADIETDPEAIDLSSSADDQFCCGGCRAAHALIQGAGLSTYYDRRSVDPEAKSLRPDETGPVDFAAHVRLDPLSGKAAASTPAAGKGAPEGATEGAPEDALAVPRTASLSLMVEGLHCAACVWLIETLLGRNPHVLKGRVNMTTRRLSLQWSVPEGAGEDLGINQILAPIQAIGYRLMPYDPGMLDQEAKKEEAHLMRAMAVAGFASGNVMLFSVSVWFGFDMDEATRTLMHWLSALVAIPAVLYAIRPFAKSAIQALRARRSNMDVPITVAVILATAVSLWETARSGPHAYFDAAVMLLFFLLVGRFLDVRARSKARSAAEHLVTLGAGSVTLERPDGSQARVPPAAVQPGMTVLVAAGERVGVDGTVQDGRSDLDMSLLTGESLPVAVDKGGQVFAGTLNLSGPLRLTAEAVGESTVLAEIVRLMEGAEQGRARYVALADRVARGYVPVVHALAAVSFLAWVLIGGMVWQQAILIAAAVLIVTCPCALALAVPVVQVVATGRLMRRGILVKSPTALERLTTVDHLVFDKTGTLTLGRLTLQTGPQEN
ncbi:MAG: heavy metal translocating P-type ATPase metal-binding domain-containing protein, partial [Rhodospirillaceae bacterium]